MNVSELIPCAAEYCLIEPQEAGLSPIVILCAIAVISLLAVFLLSSEDESSEKIERLKPHAHLISNIDPKITGFFDRLLASNLNDTAISTSTVYGHMEVDLETKIVLGFVPNPYDKMTKKLPDHPELYENLKQITPRLVHYFESTALKETMSTETYDRMLIGVTLVTQRAQILGYHQDHRTAAAALRIADKTLPANNRLKDDTVDDALLFIYKPSSSGDILPTVSVLKQGLSRKELPGYDQYPTDVREHITAECVEKHKSRFALPVMTSDRQALVVDNTKAYHTTTGAKVVEVLYGPDSVKTYFNPKGNGESLNQDSESAPFIRLSAVVFSSGDKATEDSMFSF